VLNPAVPVKKSVFPEYIVCLEDGKKLKMLKRHLHASDGLAEGRAGIRRSSPRCRGRQTSVRLVSRRKRRPHRQLRVAADGIKVKNMTASAKGTIEEPGQNVAQKTALNRALLSVAPGKLRRVTEYKMAWNGGTFTPVEAYRDSQECPACERHPADAPETKHLGHGRVSRDRFICPLCGHKADADVNAARNHLARGRSLWAPATIDGANRTTAPDAAQPGSFRLQAGDVHRSVPHVKCPSVGKLYTVAKPDREHEHPVILDDCLIFGTRRRPPRPNQPPYLSAGFTHCAPLPAFPGTL
jgi:hypothetical protein